MENVNYSLALALLQSCDNVLKFLKAKKINIEGLSPEEAVKEQDYFDNVLPLEIESFEKIIIYLDKITKPFFTERKSINYHNAITNKEVFSDKELKELKLASVALALDQSGNLQFSANGAIKRDEAVEELSLKVITSFTPVEVSTSLDNYKFLDGIWTLK